MDEEARDKKHSCKKVKYDYKRDFIENWLVNIVSRYDLQKKNRDLNSKLGTLQSDSRATSQLEIWTNSISEERVKKKLSKLQFLSALKRIFKRKKSIYERDELGWSHSVASFDSLSINTMNSSTVLNTVGVLTDDEKLGNEAHSDDSKKRDGGTQTCRKLSHEDFENDQLFQQGRLRTPAASIKTLDKFSRGFSEILQSKGYNCQDGMSLTSIGTCNDIIHGKVLLSSIDGNIIDGGRKSKENSFMIQPPNLLLQAHHRLSNEPLRGCLPNPNFCRSDSYARKVQLIQKYFGNKTANFNTFNSLPIQKESFTVIHVPMIKEQSFVSRSLDEYSALNKDLTETPYLREHEREQWQGKNRELCFRIHALYNKFKRNDCYHTKEAKSSKTFLNAIEKVVRSSNRSSEKLNKPRLPKGSQSSLSRIRCPSFANSELIRRAKIEKLFVKESIKKCQDKLKRTVTRKPVEHIKSIPRGQQNNQRTRAWYEAVEQVRASMKRDIILEGIESSKSHLIKDFRCQSKISVSISCSSDWDDISIPSVESSVSKCAMTIMQQLPNIPCHPRYNNPFRPIEDPRLHRKNVPF